MEKRLKIGMFIDTYYPMIDGVIMVVDNYAKRLAEYADVTVFCPMGRTDFDDSKFNYKVVRCKSRLKLGFLDYDLPVPGMDNHFMHELKKSNLDIVHIHSPFSIGKEGLNYAKKKKIPAISTIHSQYRMDFYKSTKSDFLSDALLKPVIRLFNRSDECWTNNEAVANIFKSEGLKSFPIIHSNATDLIPFEDEHEIEKMRAEYNIKKDEKVLIFTGRINNIKNLPFLVDSLAVLNRKGFKFKMLFVGDGPDEKKLISQVKKLGIADKTVFVGRIENRQDISKYFKLADLFLFPSTYDTNSLVQIEAATQGTPTLFLKDYATASTITPDVNGYVAYESTEAYADKIIEIFSDEAKYIEVSNNARKDIYISWDDAVKQVYLGYLDLIERYKKQRALKKEKSAKIKQSKKNKLDKESIDKKPLANNKED